MSYPSDCWIAEEDGSNKVHLAGRNQPRPIPTVVKRKAFGSEHSTIGGTLIIQARGHDSGVLEINLVNVALDVIEAIEVLYLRIVDGKKPAVQFYNSRKTYLCSWAKQDWEPKRNEKRLERYDHSFLLRILNEVEEEDP